MQEGKRRIHMLDEIRGFAILCMIVHHSFLDIGDVLALEWGYKVFDALCIVQPIFWMAFIIISGMCTRLSRNTVKRGFTVEAFAVVITLVTAVIMPLFGFTGAEIWFGILHCLGFCMIITGLFMPLIEKCSWKTGALVSALLFAVTYGIDGSKRYLLFGLVKLPASLYKNNIFAPIGFYNEHFFSADYFSILPWIFVFLFGAFLGQLAADEKLPQTMYKKRSNFLSFVGKNSLWVYIIHQPVLYIIFLIIGLFITK